MAVQTYKKTDKIQLSKNFNSREFRCGLGRPCSCTTTLIDPQLVTYLQKIRDYRRGGVYRIRQRTDLCGCGSLETRHVIDRRETKEGKRWET